MSLGSARGSGLEPGLFEALPDPLVQLLGAEADDVSQVADEPVGELLVLDLVKNVAAFVVPQRSAQLLVVHCRLALLLAPHLSHGLGLAHHELALPAPGPQRPPDHVPEMLKVTSSATRSQRVPDEVLGPDHREQRKLRNKLST